MIDLKSLYPELLAHDGLPLALQHGLAASIPDLQIQSGIRFSKLQEMSEPCEEQGLYHIACKVQNAMERSATVDIAIERHLYILTLENQANAASIFLEVDSLEQALAFLDAWLRGMADAEQLKRIESFVTFLDLKDDLQYIHWQWKTRHHNAVNFPGLTGSLAPLFARALHDAVLRQVTPFTSLSTLRLSGCTEFPFLTRGYPSAWPMYAISPHNMYIVRRRILDRAERLMEVSSDLGSITKSDTGNYTFIDRRGESLCQGDAFEVLEFILHYSQGRYFVGDAQGNGSETANATEAVDFLQNALPLNGYPSLRGSADDLDPEKRIHP